MAGAESGSLHADESECVARITVAGTGMEAVRRVKLNPESQGRMCSFMCL